MKGFSQTVATGFSYRVNDNRPTFPGGMSGKQGTAPPARVILVGAVLGGIKGPDDAQRRKSPGDDPQEAHILLQNTRFPW